MLYTVMCFHRRREKKVRRIVMIRRRELTLHGLSGLSSQRESWTTRSREHDFDGSRQETSLENSVNLALVAYFLLLLRALCAFA